MAAAGRGTAADRSDSPAAEPPSPLCLALLRSACRTVAVDGTPLPPPRDDTAGGITADVITDGPRRSRPLAEPGDADAFFEYDLEGGAAPAGVLGSSNGGGGADTGCSLTSPAEHTDGSGDGSPCPTPTTTPTTTPAAAAVATATAAAAAVAAAAAAAAAVENGLSLRRVEGADTDPEKRGCTDAGNGCDSKRHLYENPLASVPVAVPGAGAGAGGRRGRHGARDVTSRPQQSPSEKVDAWLLTCDDDVEVSEETSPAPAAAVDGEDEDEDEDEDTEDALTDADELDICELLTRGCELLELERSHAGAAAAAVDSEAERPDSLEFACAPCEPRASAAEDEPEDAPDENEDEGNGSESGVSSEFLMADRLKRSSSLKSGKTPPLTPGRKKYVRFADALGLDLQQVRTFRDEVPTVPHSAFLGLDAELFSSSPDSPFLTSFPNCAGTALDASAQRQLVPMFLQPSSGMGFEDRLRRDKVCLVNVTTHEEDWSVRGVVRVLNMDYYKTVCVRYTLDEWRTWSDAVASYVHGSCDGFADRFHFTLYCSTLSAGQRLHFAIVFRCQGQEFWDNNHGNDYTVMCALQSRSMPDDWGVGRF